MRADLQRVVEVAAKHAEAVDREARFPSETLAALKAERILGAAVPVTLGGRGLGIVALAESCEQLARACSSSAMVLAMHHIQVASLVRHSAGNASLSAYLQRLSDEQRLIASVTSEVGVGGDLRSSKCAVEISGDRFTLNKDATTISYGKSADDLLITARRVPDAAASDQVLVLTLAGEFTLAQTTQWDTLGMRGTTSPGFRVESQGKPWQIMSQPFADIAARTMVPYSHVLWAATWLGIATEAIGRARAFVRGLARANPGTTPPAAHRLAEASSLLAELRSSVYDTAREYERLTASPDLEETLLTMGYAIRINNLKISASERTGELCRRALNICGLAGYKNDGKFAIGRLLRDSLSAALMIANDRILSTNASLLLVQKD